MSAYRVVEDFEAALSEYTGAPYVVTTNSCSSALLIACSWHIGKMPYWIRRRMHSGDVLGKDIILDTPSHVLERARKPIIEIPCRTYASVPQSVIHAGGQPMFRNEAWKGAYQLHPLPVWDSARRFTSGMYKEFLTTFTQTENIFRMIKGEQHMVCISFQTSKILGLEQGGAILLDDPAADEWLRRARFDGRLNASEKLPKQIGWHCYLSPTVAALGLQHLACLPRHNEDQAGSKDFSDLSKLDIWN